MTNQSSSSATNSSGAKGGGNNNLHQIIMAVITTIAAPVIVFFVTNNLKNSSAPAPTPVIQVITATAPAAVAASPTQAEGAPTKVQGTAVEKPTSTATTAPSATRTTAATSSPTAAAKPTEKPTQAPAVLPTLDRITNPSGTIPAGTAVQVDGLVLTISAQDVKADGKTISLSVHIKNTGAERRELAFTAGSLSLKDDTGHTYAPLYGDKKSGCKKGDLGETHKLVIDPQKEVTLVSVSEAKPADWCAKTPGSAIPLFTGPLGKNAKKLEVQVNGVGPFKGFQVEIGL